MAYAAYAKVDPRLLAQDYGNNSAAITAAGKGISDVLNQLAKNKTDAEVKEKEDEDRRHVEFKRKMEYQKVLDDWTKKRDLNVAGASANPPEFPGFSNEGGRLIADTEVNNIADGMTDNRRNRRKKRNERRIGRGQDVLKKKKGDVEFDTEGNPILETKKPEAVTEVQVDPLVTKMYTSLNTINPGAYNKQYSTVEKALTAKANLGKAQVSLGQKVGPLVEEIVTQPGFDSNSPNNAQLVSFSTALSADPPGVHTITNHLTNTAEYAWQNAETGEWEVMPATNVTALSLNRGKKADLAQTSERFLDKIAVGDVLKADFKLLKLAATAEEGLPGIEAIEQSIEVKSTNLFTEDEDLLNSYVRNADLTNIVELDPTQTKVTLADIAGRLKGKVNPLTGKAFVVGDNEITASDAASYVLGTVRGDQRWAGAWTSPVNEKASSKITNYGQEYNTLNERTATEFQNKNVTHFSNLGFNNVRFQGEGKNLTMSYTTLVPEIDSVTKKGTGKFTPAYNTIKANDAGLHELTGAAISRGQYSTTEKRELLNFYEKPEAAIVEGDEIVEEKVVKVDHAKSASELLYSKAGVKGFKGKGQIRNIFEDVFGNELTIFKLDGTKVRIDPDEPKDMEKLGRLMLNEFPKLENEDENFKQLKI